MADRRQEHFESVFRTLGQAHRGSFVRAVPLEFQDTPLSAFGSRGGGRYNAAGSFEVLYLGENADTVARETRLIVLDAAGNDVAKPQPPTIIMTVEYDLQRAADLTDRKVLDLFGIRPAALLTKWLQIVRRGRVPVTHWLGAAALVAGVEALIVPSKRYPGRANVAVIEENLLRGSFVAIHDPRGFRPSITTRIDGMK